VAALGSTTRSAGCGSSTSPTARRASASATSTSSSSPWHAGEQAGRPTARRARRAPPRRAAARPDPGVGRVRGGGQPPAPSS
jgi:hypothetical protein